MRELSDGTCQPCTTSEVAALKGNEPPTRSPSVNPIKPLRTPVRPALSPLGRPGLAAVPGPHGEAGNAPAHLQEADRQPYEAPKASASKPLKQGSRCPDQATGPCQQRAEAHVSSDKENGVYWNLACCSAWAGGIRCTHAAALPITADQQLAKSVPGPV